MIEVKMLRGTTDEKYVIGEKYKFDDAMAYKLIREGNALFVAHATAPAPDAKPLPDLAFKPTPAEVEATAKAKTAAEAAAVKPKANIPATPKP